MTSSFDRDTVDRLCRELLRLTGDGPGKNEVALNRVRDIIRQFSTIQNDYVRQKAAETLDDFETWFSPRRWTRFGTESDFRFRLYSTISKLENAAGQIGDAMPRKR
jgi:hypothetical protein